MMIISIRLRIRTYKKSRVAITSDMVPSLISVGSTLEHMYKNGWRLNVCVIRVGIPSTFLDELEAKCKGDTI